MRGRRGEYVDRSTVTVEEDLTGWLDVHELEVKPQTLAGYRDLLGRYVLPTLGRMRMQAVQPQTITLLYRDLLATGGRRGTGLSHRTVDLVHAIPRKAFGDAVRIDQVLPTNPVERAKRPRREQPGPRSVWSADQLATFLGTASGHPLGAFFRLAAYSGGSAR